MSGELMPSAEGLDFNAVAALLVPQGTTNPYLHDAADYLRRVPGELGYNDEESQRGNLNLALGEHALATGNEELARLVFDTAPLYQKILLFSEAESDTSQGATARGEWAAYFEDPDIQHQIERDPASNMVQQLVEIEGALRTYAGATWSDRRQCLRDVDKRRNKLSEDLKWNRRVLSSYIENDIITTRLNIALMKAGLVDELQLRKDPELGEERTGQAYAALARALVGEFTMPERFNVVRTEAIDRATRTTKAIGSRAIIGTTNMLSKALRGEPSKGGSKKLKELAEPRSYKEEIKDRQFEEMIGVASEIQRAARSKKGIGRVALRHVLSVGREEAYEVFAQALPAEYSKTHGPVRPATEVRMYLAADNLREATKAYVDAKVISIFGHESATHVQSALLLSRHELNARAAATGHEKFGQLWMDDVHVFREYMDAVKAVDQEKPSDGILENLHDELQARCRELITSAREVGSPAHRAAALASLLRISHDINPQNRRHSDLLKEINASWKILEATTTTHAQLSTLRQYMESEGYDFVRRRDKAGYIGYAARPEFADPADIAQTAYERKQSSHFSVEGSDLDQWRATLDELHQLLGEQRYSTTQSTGDGYGGKSLVLGSSQTESVVPIQELNEVVKSALKHKQPLHSQPGYTQQIEAAFKATAPNAVSVQPAR